MPIKEIVLIVKLSLSSKIYTVGNYKSLSVVDRAFRFCKTIDLIVRLVYHYQDTGVIATILLCMLAYYVEWHLRKLLAPILFDRLDYLKPALTEELIVTA